MQKRSFNILIIKSVFLLLFVLFFHTAAHAATFGVSPSSGTYTVGKTFTVTFFVGSSSQSINAVSTNFTYSSDTLEITGVSKSGSIISLWSPGGEPQYSLGTGSFEGIITNPGFTGSFGKIVSYTFRVKNTGTGRITFSGSSILANDGNGTNVFTGAGGGTFTFVAAEKPVTPTPKPVTPVSPVKPVTPTPKPVEIETPKSIVDGALDIQELPKENNQLRFKIGVRNSTQGIKKYEIRVNQNEPIIWEDVNKDGIFTLPILTPGSYTLLVKVLEINALITGYLDFSIEALPKPVMLYYSKKSHIGQQPIVAYGTHEVYGTITALIKKGQNIMYSETISIDPQQRFLFVINDKVPPGKYTLEFFAQDEFGLLSEYTTPVKISVKRYPYIDIGIFTVPIGLITLFLTLLAIGGWILVYMYHRKNIHHS